MFTVMSRLTIIHHHNHENNITGEMQKIIYLVIIRTEVQRVAGHGDLTFSSADVAKIT